MLTFNGKPFNANDFSKALQKQALALIVAQVQEKYGSIRHPVTGEFPTVYAAGDTLEAFKVRIEGSAPLLALVKERFTGDDENLIALVEKPVRAPKVFLSYAWDDKVVAKRIATTFMNSGIDTWWAEWCMQAGDSLRQRIDEGLSDCTHFVVLLTPRSIIRPWVNQEMDAGLVRKLNAQAKFIPLRYEQKWPRLFEQLSPIFKWTLCGLQMVQSCPRRRSALTTNRQTRRATRGAPRTSSYAASFNFCRPAKYASSGVARSRLE
jgi:hypothetical protein